MRSECGAEARADRWLVTLPLGLFFWWVTAANTVNLTSLAVRPGLVEAGVTGKTLLGAALLLFWATLAAVESSWVGNLGRQSRTGTGLPATRR